MRIRSLFSLEHLCHRPTTSFRRPRKPPSQLQGLLAREWDQGLTFFFSRIFSVSVRSGYAAGSRPRPIKTKVQKEPGFDFIDFIEGQFGAILYSMVLFLLFFMLIFSTVMRMMLVRS